MKGQYVIGSDPATDSSSISAYYLSGKGIEMVGHFSGIIDISAADFKLTPLEKHMAVKPPIYISIAKYLTIAISVTGYLTAAIYGLMLFAQFFNGKVNPNSLGVSIGLIIIYMLMGIPVVYVVSCNAFEGIYEWNRKRRFLAKVSPK